MINKFRISTNSLKNGHGRNQSGIVLFLLALNPLTSSRLHIFIGMDSLVQFTKMARKKKALNSQNSGTQSALNDKSSKSKKNELILTQQKTLKSINNQLYAINRLPRNSFFKSQSCVIMDTDSLDSLILSDPLLT